MAAIGTVKVEMTPEIREAIDYLVPVVRTSEALYRCQCEFADEQIGLAACQELQDSWETAVEKYMNRPGTVGEVDV